MNRVYWFVASVLIGMAPQAAFADATSLEPEIPSELHAPFTLVVNQVRKSEIIIVLKDGDVLVERDDLEAAGVMVPGGRNVEIAGQPMLSLKSVSPPLRYTLDENDIVLRIVAPAELLPTVTIDLEAKPSKVIYRQDTSAFFNYAPRINEHGNIDFYDELGLSVGGSLLASSMYLSSERQPVRGLTNLTVDDRRATRRIVFGDSFASTGVLGSSRFLAGATLMRAYELNPYALRIPTLGFSGTTLTPATVDVYVNDARVRSEQVQPGRFELKNLRVGGGAGTARYVIRDVFGGEETFSSDFYVSTSVLAPGLDEYSYSFGALRSNIGQTSWDYGQVAFMGRHRVGVTNAITLGGRLEARDETISAGPVITTQTPIGQFELELGASRSTRNTPGFASSLTYSFAARRFGAGLIGRYVSDRYATVGTSIDDDRTTREVGLFASAPLGKEIAISSQAAVTEARDRGVGSRVSGQVGTRLAGFMNVTVGGGVTEDQRGTVVWTVFASLSATLPENQMASVRSTLEKSGPSAQFMLSRSPHASEDFGYRAIANLDVTDSADISAQYQVPFGRYGAAYLRDMNGNHLTLDAAGALVVVPGVGLFASRPVQDGFGVIRLAGVRGVRGYVNNQEVGKTNHDGNLLVPNLLSYYGNRLSVETEDIPMRYSLEKSEMSLAPPNRGAAIADFPVTVPHYCRGHVVVAKRGVRIIPKYGEFRIQRETDEFVSPIGEDGAFELEGIASGAHRIVIDYAEGVCETVLNIVSSNATIVELGEIECTTQ